MDAKETARRSDALYADGVRYHRRDLCDMIAYREADIKRLEAALDTAVEDASSVYSHLIGEYMAENTRLRELVRGYDSALHRMCSQAQSYTNCHCSDCVLAKGYEGADTCATDDLLRETRKLRIEVDR